MITILHTNCTDANGLKEFLQVDCTDANGLKEFLQVNCTDANGLKEFLQVNCTDANGLKEFLQVDCTDANGLKDFSQMIFIDTNGLSVIFIIKTMNANENLGVGICYFLKKTLEKFQWLNVQNIILQYQTNFFVRIIFTFGGWEIVPPFG